MYFKGQTDMRQSTEFKRLYREHHVTLASYVAICGRPLLGDVWLKVRQLIDAGQPVSQFDVFRIARDLGLARQPTWGDREPTTQMSAKRRP